MGKLTLTQLGLASILNDANDPAGSVLNGASGRLYTDAVAWSKDTVLADLTEATFGGYGSVTPVVWTAALGPGSVPFLGGNVLAYTASGVGLPQTIGGWYLVGDPAGVPFLIGGYEFSDPVILAAADQTILTQINLIMDAVDLSLPGVCL